MTDKHLTALQGDTGCVMISSAVLLAASLLCRICRAE